VSPLPVPPTVRRVTGADVLPLAALLVRAFDDDPVSNYIFTGTRRRARGLHAFFTALLRREYLPLGEVFTTDDRGGVALWGPPDRVRRPLRELARLLPVAPYLAGRHPARALRFLAEVDALHPKEPHWYLATLGAEPARQGTGIGSALLTSTLARIDQEGEPAYLESSKERNVPLYARHGFEVMDEFRFSADAPPMWRMWREPRVPEL
jgi:GNAT superfamily N-acetyltransferase